MRPPSSIHFSVVGLGALLSIASLASGQAIVTRITGPQPWRAASADSDSEWFPERNEMAISADDRWVAFESQANNLTAADHNPNSDIFVFEVATGRITGITSNRWLTANAWSYDPAISADGRYVVFASNASNLVAGDSNSNSDVFLVDRDPDANGIFDEQAYAFERISIETFGGETHGSCISPAISDDGTRVLFLSDADDLVVGDFNASNDAFLRDRNAGTTERVDVDSSGDEANFGCSFADLSADGNVVAFSSASDDLVVHDTNGAVDVFVRDLASGVTERASVTNSGAQANAQSFVFRHCLSADGSMVAFQSDATNLTTDTNGWRDVFVRDRTNTATLLVSVTSKGKQGNGDSTSPTISGDGSRVTFASFADNFTSGDGNGTLDVFLHDRNAGTTTLLSAVSGGGATANGASGAATVSADGTQVVLSSTASDLVATGDVAGFRDVFLTDLAAGTMRYVSALPAGDANGESVTGSFVAIAPSSDCRFFAFESDATNLVDGDQNGARDVFVAAAADGSIRRVSIATGGGEANGWNANAAISADGRFVVFESLAGNLVAADANGKYDVFLHDRDPDGNGVFDEANGVTTLVSVDPSGAAGNDASWNPSLSADGTRIAFVSAASNLSPLDGNHILDIIVRDTVAAASYVASVADQSTTTGDDDSYRPSISADGQAVAFYSLARNLGGFDVLVHRLDTGATVSVFDACQLHGLAVCAKPCISSEGTRVGFSNWSQDAIGVGDLVDGSSAILHLSHRVREEPTFSADGRCLAFWAPDSLDPDDTNSAVDAYLVDVEQDEYGAISGLSPPVLVSVGLAGAAGNGLSFLCAPSDDGERVLFASDATDLVVGDLGGVRDVFLYDRTRVARWSNYGAGYSGSSVPPKLTAAAAPVLGSSLTIDVGNPSGVPTTALVYVSARPADVALAWGATFLVDLSVAFHVVVAVGPTGGSLTGSVPNDPGLIGVSAFLQALEHDDGSPHRLSFTSGLELHFGN